MAEYIAPVAQLLTALAAVGGLYVSWRNGKAIEIVHHLTNSMKDELVAEVRKSARAAGKVEGKAEERANPQTAASPVQER